MAVTRCVCHRHTFAELLPRCRSHGWTTLDAIAVHTRAGTGCGACRPYLAAMLATGATSFSVRTDPTACIRPAPPDPWDTAALPPRQQP